MIRAERAARLAAEARAGDLEIARAALEMARLEATQAQAARYALELEIERLKLQIAKLRRQHFGTSSERSARLEQLLLALEDLEESAAHMDAEAEAKDAAAAPEAPQWRSWSGPSPPVGPCPVTCRADAWSFLVQPIAPAAAEACANLGKS
jgi:transposase